MDDNGYRGDWNADCQASGLEPLAAFPGVERAVLGYGGDTGHVLGRLLRRLAADWRAKYALELSLAETFVERGRFAGVCYRAANWQCVGHTCGRSRGDREHRLQVPIKDIYLHALRTDFRERLCQ